MNGLLDLTLGELPFSSAIEICVQESSAPSHTP